MIVLLLRHPRQLIWLSALERGWNCRSVALQFLLDVILKKFQWLDSCLSLYFLPSQCMGIDSNKLGRNLHFQCPLLSICFEITFGSSFTSCLLFSLSFGNSIPTC